MRNVLEEARIHPAIRARIAGYRQDVVREVEAAIAANEYGSYFSEWRRRLALKLWTGWPTFPMVFVKGELIGGTTELQKLLESGELRQLRS